jgi:hypothetical protein
MPEDGTADSCRQAHYRSFPLLVCVAHMGNHIWAERLDRYEARSPEIPLRTGGC